MNSLYMGACLLAGLAIGCGGGPQSLQVEGRVSFNGTPVPSGAVIFLDALDQRCLAEIGEDGRYQTDLPAGEHRVGISAPRETTSTGFEAFEEPSLPPYVPFQYADPTHSGLVVTVEEDGDNVFDFPLKDARRR